MFTTEKRIVPVNLDVFENVPFSEIHALTIIQAPTPLEWIKTRETGYGQNKKLLSYVSGDTVERILNKAFNYRWSFEVVQIMVVPSADKVVVDKNTKEKEYIPQADVVQCHGRLTVPGWGIREQFGAQILVGGSETQEHAYKSATTDAMKKCASAFGIALDLYGTAGMYDLMSGAHDYAYDDKVIIEKYKEKLLLSKEELKPAEVAKADIPERKSEDELIAEATDAGLAEAEAGVETAVMPEPIVPPAIPVPEPIAPPVQTAPAPVQPTPVAAPVASAPVAQAAPAQQPAAPVTVEPDPAFEADLQALLAQGRIEDAAVLKAAALMETLDGRWTFEEVKEGIYRDLLAEQAKRAKEAAQDAASAAPAQTIVTGPNLSMNAPAQTAPADRWNADEVNRLKRLKKVLNVGNEGLLGYMQDFFGTTDVTIHSVTPDNIADFNHYLDEVIADAMNGAPGTQFV